MENGGLARQRQVGQDGGDDDVKALGEEEQRSAIARVGQHAAKQGEEHDGNDAHQAERAQAQRLRAQFNGAAQKLDGERLAAQKLIEVPVDGDELHLRADDGNEEAKPEDAKVAETQGRRETQVHNQLSVVSGRGPVSGIQSVSGEGLVISGSVGQ